MITPVISRPTTIPNLSADCHTLTLTDNTGNYDPITNPTGYHSRIKLVSITGLSGSNVIISLFLNNVAKTFQEGIQWHVGVDVPTTLANIAAAIASVTGLATSVSGNEVLIYPSNNTYIFTQLLISNPAIGPMYVSVPSRDNLALKLFVSLEKSTGYEVIPLVYTPTVPSNQNGAFQFSWNVPIDEDGYYSYYAVLVPVFDNYLYSVGYAQDSIVYNTSDQNYYGALVASPTSVPPSPSWQVLVNREDFEEGVNTFDNTVDDLIICFSNKCASQANLKFSKKGCCDSDEKRAYECIRGLIEGAVFSAGMNDYSGAQLIVESIQLKCLEIECNCGCDNC